ncbi:hypothetical protein SK224_01425 [Microbacterium sp. BG28]|uniref:hypothetical protein n=1 Tax=Microbacterium sp. BG28 TaxID=3097356 RepID=UPI002A5A84FC|nr:hypothetical protein [Microbacterium sp. BG28]MDY0827778.1 hypothetical protein [Microbacterium sp. BG28]
MNGNRTRRSWSVKIAAGFAIAAGVVALSVTPATAVEVLTGGANCGNYYANITSTSTGQTEQRHFGVGGAVASAYWYNPTSTFRISAKFTNLTQGRVYSDMVIASAGRSCDY